MARNLRLVLGDELSPAAAEQVTRDWRLRQRFLSAACHRLPGHLHRAPVVQLRRRPSIRRTMARGAVLEAGAAISAAADYRAMAWPAPGGSRPRPPGPAAPRAVTLAQLTGAPLLMGIAHRAADYRHQVLEISAPVPVDGDIKTVFERCAAEVSAAIRRSPASWAFWPDTGDLAAMGLIPPPRDGSPAAGGTMSSTTSALTTSI